MSEVTFVGCSFQLLFAEEMHGVSAVHVLLKLLKMES